VGELVAPEPRLSTRLLVQDPWGAGCGGGFAQVVLERVDLGAGLSAAEVVQVVAGDTEQPAPERLGRPAKPGQAVDGAGEGGAGEVLGLVAVADRRQEEAEQGGA
jgi:hypothetical protein